MIEEIFEAILEIALAGAIEGSTSSKVPKALRWLLRIIVFVVYTFILGVMILATLAFFRCHKIALGILMIVLTVIFANVTIVKAVKILRSK